VNYFSIVDNSGFLAMSDTEEITDVVNLTLADRVFGQIQDAIVKGELIAGAKISEAELTTRYGVSRGPCVKPCVV
jgi:DNA-binding GntR family transcriptional regulator